MVWETMARQSLVAVGSAPRVRVWETAQDGRERLGVRSILHGSMDTQRLSGNGWVPNVCRGTVGMAFGSPMPVGERLGAQRLSGNG